MHSLVTGHPVLLPRLQGEFKATQGLKRKSRPRFDLGTALIAFDIFTYFLVEISVVSKASEVLMTLELAWNAR